MDMSFKFGLRAGMAAYPCGCDLALRRCCGTAARVYPGFFPISSFDFDAFRTYPGFCPICSTE